MKTTKVIFSFVLLSLLLSACHLPTPGEGDVTPVIHLGSLYAGMTGNNVVTFCYDGSYVTRITWSAEMQCTDKTTNEQYYRSEVFSVGLDALMVAGSDGYFSLIYEVDPAISVNTAISVEGHISRGGGNVTLAVQSDSDVEFCGSGFITIPVHPAGTECSGE